MPRKGMSSGSGSRPRSTRRTSNYKGLTWLDYVEAWKVDIEIHGSDHYVGIFESEVLAAISYDDAAVYSMRHDPNLNFDLNFGNPSDTHALARRQRALEEERAPARVVNEQAATSATRNRRRSSNDQSSGSNKRSRSEADQSLSSAAAAAQPSQVALEAEVPTLDIRAEIVHSIFDGLHWHLDNGSVLVAEILHSGHLKLKFSNFGMSFVFSRNAEPHIEYPVFLSQIDMLEVKYKLVSLLRAYSDIEDPRYNALILQLIVNILEFQFIPYHHQLTYFSELLLTRSIATSRKIPLQTLPTALLETSYRAQYLEPWLHNFASSANGSFANVTPYFFPGLLMTPSNVHTDLFFSRRMAAPGPSFAPVVSENSSSSNAQENIRNTSESTGNQDTSENHQARPS